MECAFSSSSVMSLAIVEVQLRVELTCNNRGTISGGETGQNFRVSVIYIFQDLDRFPTGRTI